MFVALQKSIIGQTVFGTFILDLWVGKSDPNFINFIFSKQMFYQFDLRTNKSYIRELLFYCCFGTTPKTRTFDVNPNEIFVGISLGQTDSVFTLSTAQFQN